MMYDSQTSFAGNDDVIKQMWLTYLQATRVVEGAYEHASIQEEEA